MTDGYCDNGIHYIGDRDICVKCRVWQAQQMEGHLYHAARRARALQHTLAEVAP
jgi:hypothetical protein